MSYIHLQVRSGYSLMNSTITIERLVEKAKSSNFPAIALTDEGVLYGAIPFYQACRKAGIKPIIGLILPVANGKETSEVTLLAKNNTGYHHLIRLSTMLQVEERESIPLEQVEEYADGLIAILPAKDPVFSARLKGNDFQEAKGYLERFQHTFAPEDFYVGVERQGRTATLLEQFASVHPVSVTAITDVRYLEEKDVYSYACLLAMKHGKEWDMERTDKSLRDKHLRHEEEVELALGGLFPEAVRTTEKIADRCHVDIDFSTRLLPSFPLEDEVDAHTYLENLCERNLREKYREPSLEMKERLAYELSVIKTMGFSDYFLIIADIVAYAKSKGIAVGPGRGSSAGSLVAYVLGITDVDPLEFDLLFERFLNPERQTMPDIDIDFSDERRDEVIEYVREKYGKEHVAQIITFGTFAARSLIRELIKTLNVDPEDARYILREFPTQSSKPLAETMKSLPELSEYVKQSNKLKLLFSIAVRLEGLPRHISTHAAGVVISNEPLVEHVPLTTGTGDTYLTQYAMNELEAIGLLKMDFLGLRNLSLLEKVLHTINYGKNDPLSLEDMPEHDEKTYELLREGRTNGIFQLESEGMKRVLKELKPTSFEDIVAVNALYRPGPMDFIPTYIRRKHQLEPVTYPHDDLKPILEKTYGVLVYQEQIIQIAHRIAGFSFGEADILRRAVSKKDESIMEEQREAFLQGCIENGYSRDVATEIFSWIVRFSNYGFPRSHAVAYSKISYQLSYLKANYPAQFFAEVLSTVRNQQDKLQLYLKELHEIGIELLPPSINRSIWKFTVEKGAIRMGLSSIKGIGRDAIFAIIKARKTGPFKHLFDFCLRVSDVKRSAVENLILAGAFDELYANRASLLASLDQAMEQGELFREFRDQPNLFEDTLNLVENYVEIEDFPLTKKLQDEKELVGMYLSSHPLENYRKNLRACSFLSIAEMEKATSRRNMQTAVIVQEIKQIRTKRGEQMAFLTIADEENTMEAVLFPDTYRNVKRWLEEEQLVVLTGKTEERNGDMQFIIDDAAPFSESILDHRPEQVLFIKSVEETNPQALKVIQRMATRYPGDVPIVLYNEVTQQTYRLKEDYFLHPAGACLHQLRQFFGKEHVVLQRTGK